MTADRIEQAAPDVREVIQTMHSTASGLEHASRMIEAGEIPQSSAILNCAAHCRQAAAKITQLQAELAEQKKRLGNALKLQMDERHKSEDEAKMWFDKAQKWGAELAEAREVPGRIVDWLRGEVQYHRKHPEDQAFAQHIATAIEARDWSKP